MAKKETISSLIGEELKDEIYRIVELALSEKLEEYDKRIRDLELAKAEIIEVENDIKQEMDLLKGNLRSEKKSVSKELIKINADLEKILAILEALVEKKTSKKR